MSVNEPADANAAGPSVVKDDDLSSINFTYTFDDFTEVMRGAAPRRELAGLIAIRWPILFIVAMAYALPQNLNFPFLSMQSPYISAMPQQNLWVSVVPSLTMTSYLLLSYIVHPGFLRRRQSAALLRKRRQIDPVELIMMLPFLWALPVAWPKLAVPWQPTDGQMVWAAFAPWPIYFALVQGIAAYRRRQTVRESWSRMPSLHRTTRVDINSIGVVSRDDLITHEYRWKNFKRYGESKSLLLLVTEDEQTLFLPKRAIQNDQMITVKRLICDHVAEGRFAPQLQAFPVTALDGSANPSPVLDEPPRDSPRPA